MSARESIEYLWDRATPVGPLLDAYAHELAEKQREYMRAGALSIAEVISVIDPETEEKRCDMHEAHTWHRWVKDGVVYVCKSVALNGGA